MIVEPYLRRSKHVPLTPYERKLRMQYACEVFAWGGFLLFVGILFGAWVVSMVRPIWIKSYCGEIAAGRMFVIGASDEQVRELCNSR